MLDRISAIQDFFNVFHTPLYGTGVLFCFSEYDKYHVSSFFPGVVQVLSLMSSSQRVIFVDPAINASSHSRYIAILIKSSPE